jgi:uncharacterized protein YjcR
MSDLTTKDVADRYGVGDATVRLWRRRKLFPHAYELETPRGCVWMIPERDLKGFEPPKKTGRPRKPKTEETAMKASGRKRGGKK